ncbi:hypothetical protein B0H19DRAFT_193648 [Mycena capillaripes]|nr:hypothetical protein B0H19DRAFT_193648 [Mycena capillaripes]
MHTDLLYTALTYSSLLRLLSLNAQLLALCTPLFAGGRLAVSKCNIRRLAMLSMVTPSLLIYAIAPRSMDNAYTQSELHQFRRSSTRLAANALSIFKPATHPCTFPVGGAVPGTRAAGRGKSRSS